MKNLLFLITILFCLNSAKGQVDFSLDYSKYCVYASAKVTYPLFDKVIVGASYGYNIMHTYELTNRFDGVVGFKLAEWIQFEADFGLMQVQEYPNVYRHDSFLDDKSKLTVINGQYFKPHFEAGAKFHLNNNLFCSLQFGTPMIVRVGIGVRLRPYKQLSRTERI